MQWIDEMFVNMEKDRTAASVKRSEKAAKVDPARTPEKASPRHTERLDWASFLYYE